MNYGERADGTAKGFGYFGELQRPDGSVSTEISIGVGIDGKEVEIPLIVPTLDKRELDWLLRNDPQEKGYFDKMPPSILDKAYEHAVQRMKAGKSPFASEADIEEPPQ